MLAPLIKPIRVQGGTFFTFSSASRDLGLSFNDSQNKFRFSKFSLLNIPNVGNSDTGQNLINFSNTPGAFTDINGSMVVNDYLAESFQNYCLNLEAMVTSSPDFDSTVLTSVSERVFFKWLKEIGAIRFRQASIGTEQSSSAYGARFVEEDESTTYNKVIKYVGEINILNTVRNNNNAYSEVYVYLPVSHGSTPVVLFNTLSDNNYTPNQVFTNNPSNVQDAGVLYGRESESTIHPAGLSINAYFDSPSNSFAVLDPFGAEGKFYSYDPVTSNFIQEGQPGFSWWYPDPIENSYFTQPNTFNDPTNDTLQISSVNKQVTYVRSRLDGITTEFNTALYSGMSSAAVPDFGTYNESASAQSFDFNAVLVYYDLYNPTTGNVASTNLFGILFLDKVNPTLSGGGYIPALTKYKPNTITGDNGNSYGFRLNLMFDVNAQDTSIEVSINDYNPYSLELYMDALNEMNAAYQLMTTNNATLTSMQQQLNNLQSLLLTSATSASISSQIAVLQKTITDNGLIYTNNANLLNLIQRNYTEITNIYKNTSSVQMSYNLGVIQQGPGVIVDGSSGSNLVISSANQTFNIGTDPIISISTNFSINPSSFSYIHQLINFTNYMKITDGSYQNPYSVDRDVIIYIDDSVNKWVAGQTIRISFKFGLNLSTTSGNFNFIIYTDANDSLNAGFPYSAEAAYVTYTDFIINNNSPIIELICIDPSTYQFAFDIF